MALKWIAYAAVLLVVVGVSCTSESSDAFVGASDSARCPRGDAVYLQVLGSGGPMHAEGRGGSSYALWLADRPVIVVDMGANTPTALTRAGAVPGSVDVLLLSHFHADHVSGLPDFLWGEAAAERRQPLSIVGPDGNGQSFPGLPDFLQRLIGPEGAFPALGGLTKGTPFALQITTLPVAEPTPQAVLERGGVRVTALSVPHGAAPALAYRVDGPGFSIVFGGDQSALNPRFSEFAAGVDMLILHATVNDRAKEFPVANMVGIPERLGAAARESGAGRLVLSHLMGQSDDSEQAKLWSLSDLDGVLASVRREYQGDVTVASDLLCLAL